MLPVPPAGPPSPHDITPVIAEVLFDVPAGVDPNRDGTRDAIGDEFVEILNPGPFPLDLRDWTISHDGAEFTFPPCTLESGAIAVCFNGYRQRWIGPVGDDDLAPPGPNQAFAEALVFTMRRGRQGFPNVGGVVTLSDPEGRVVDRMAWDGSIRGRSLVRGPSGDPVPHPGRVGCSPGERTPDGMAHQAQRDDRDRTP